MDIPVLGTSSTPGSINISFFVKCTRSKGRRHPLLHLESAASLLIKQSTPQLLVGLLLHGWGWSPGPLLPQAFLGGVLLQPVSAQTVANLLQLDLRSVHAV